MFDRVRRVSIEVLILAGLGALGYGFHQVWPPLAWIFGGGAAVAFGLVWSRT